MAATAGVPRIELRDVTKIYPSVVANRDVSLTAMPGELHAVLGENGAGKSTLMKIIYGVVKPDAGEMLWEGKPVVVDNPAQARELGIGMVFQHFSLFETLTVAQNVALALPGRPALGPLSKRITEVSERYGLPVDPRRLVHSLSVGERQRVEIIRCLLVNPRLLIMDEPTSVLTPHAVRKLFETLRQLAGEGCTILYISHKLDEIQELCTHATVLRGGVVTGHCDPHRETPATMARMMIGKDLPHPQRAEAVPGVPRLVLTGLTVESPDPFGVDLRDIDLSVRAGEIVGIAGVSGNGQKELLAAVSGEEPVSRRSAVMLCGTEAGRLRAGRRRRLGLCFVPEERLGRGAVPQMSLADNALLTTAHRGYVRNGWIRFRAVAKFAATCIEQFAVKCGGPQSEAKSLSGGNLQKFIVGREILQQPQVLVVAQPTWGVDVGAAAFIRQKIIDLRNDGAAILIVSEELDELFEVSDRLVVIAKGRLSPARPIRETSIEEIGVWMSGMWPGASGGEPSAPPGKEERHAAQA
jgi:simple sugar transport system ATP-binding protein